MARRSMRIEWTGSAAGTIGLLVSLVGGPIGGAPTLTAQGRPAARLTLETTPERTRYRRDQPLRRRDGVRARGRRGVAASPPDDVRLHARRPGAAAGRRRDGRRTRQRRRCEQAGQTRVYVQANIHGGEVEGKEAVQQLLRELVEWRASRLAASMVLLIAPIYNADGNERVRMASGRCRTGRSAASGAAPTRRISISIAIT